MTEDLGSHVLPCFKHFLLGMHLILARPTTQAPLNATGSTKRLCAASESCLKENKRNLLQRHDDNQAGPLRQMEFSISYKTMYIKHPDCQRLRSIIV